MEDRYLRFYRASPTENFFWNVHIGKEMEDRSLQKLLETEKELLAYVDPISFALASTKNYVNNFLDILNKLLERDVRIRVLVGSTEKTPKLKNSYFSFVGLLDHLEIRMIRSLATPFNVMDNEKSSIKVGYPARFEEFIAAIFIWKKSLAEELKQKFDFLWNKAKEVKTTSK